MPVCRSTSSNCTLLLRVIGTRRIAGGGANPAVFLSNQIFRAQVLAAAESPLFADAFVQILGKRFRQPVGQRLGHDRVVIVMIGFEFFHQFVEAVAAGDGEGAEVISVSMCPRRLAGSCARTRRDAGGTFRRNEIGQAPIGRAVRLFDLLPQEMERRQDLRARFVRVKFHVVPHSVCRE